MDFQRSLVIFRRDLRLFDNTALRKAAQNSKEIVPVFIFDDRQVGDTNEYKGLPALQFLLESIDDLDSQLQQHHGKLHVLHGKPEQVVSDLIDELDLDAVFVNYDVTPFSQQRDEAIKHICNQKDVAFVSCQDLFLTTPGSIRTQQETPYKVFTPFMRSAKERQIPAPQDVPTLSLYTQTLTHNWSEYTSLVPEPQELFMRGGREPALEVLKNISEYTNYKQERDIPAIKGTTGLSAYHKFGVISVRETYHAVLESLGADHTIISELYWRDFFSHVAYDFPHVFGNEFKEKYQGMKWNQDKELFDAWCQGKTGYPIVDAGMRELNNTGYMHNRVRMIVASFLTKDLRLDWRLGEKYFAQRLIDYDPSVNNGNWQWAASTGVDAQPYFRIFNPTSQQKKYDAECEYIKKWVPELRDVKPKHIHKLVDGLESVDEYPEPIVDHSEERKETLAWFKSL
jgi:deoxyribodipyrimidine photo-lyase